MRAQFLECLQPKQTSHSVGRAHLPGMAQALSQTDGNRERLFLIKGLPTFADLRHAIMKSSGVDADRARPPRRWTRRCTY